jgi:outer membrane protein assembly factor BamB
MSRTAKAALLLLFFISSCRGADDAERTRAEAAAVQRPVLKGASTNAWLCPRGDMADSGYCDAQLSLADAAKPAWEYSYTPGRFLRSDVRWFAHYNGVLAAGGEGPQILALSPRDGSELFNADLFERGGRNFSREQFRFGTLDPGGRLLLTDNIGRRYCFDIRKEVLSGDRPPRLWLSSPSGEVYPWGAIADEGILFTGWNHMLHGVDLRTGEDAYSHPAYSVDSQAAFLSDDNGNAVIADSVGSVISLDLASGETRWQRLRFRNRISSMQKAILNKWLGQIYLMSDSPVLEAVDLETGTDIWSFNIEPLYNEAEKRTYAGLGQTLRPKLLCASPEGVCCILPGGRIAALDAQGRPRWTTRLDSVISNAFQFRNAVLVEQYFAMPYSETALIQLAGSVNAPEWKFFRDYYSERGINIRPYDPAGPNIIPSNIRESIDPTFSHFTALDAATGEILGSFDADIIVSSIIPAGEMIVLGGGVKLKELSHSDPDFETRYIQAFSCIK